MSEFHKIYTAKSQGRDFVQVCRSMADGMARSRYLALRLVINDIRGQYSKSIVGILWDLIDPLVLGMVFYSLQLAGYLSAKNYGMPYIVFLITGIFMFLMFSDALLLSVEAIRRSRSILTQVFFPPEGVILAVLFRVIFNSIFRLAVILTFVVAFHDSGPASAHYSLSAAGFLKFLLLCPSLILIGMSLGILLAPFNAISIDVGRFVQVLITPLRFTSPVFFVFPDTFGFKILNIANPVGVVLGNLRNVVVHDTLPDPVGFAVRIIIFGALFLVAWFVFHVSIPVLAERA